MGKNTLSIPVRITIIYVIVLVCVGLLGVIDQVIGTRMIPKIAQLMMIPLGLVMLGGALGIWGRKSVVYTIIAVFMVFGGIMLGSHLLQMYWKG